MVAVRYVMASVMAAGLGLGAVDDGGTVELTLQDAIELASKEGYDARRGHLDLIAARQKLRGTRGEYGFRADLFLQSPNFAETFEAIQVPNSLPIYNSVGA